MMNEITKTVVREELNKFAKSYTEEWQSLTGVTTEVDDFKFDGGLQVIFKNENMIPGGKLMELASLATTYQLKWFVSTADNNMYVIMY